MVSSTDWMMVWAIIWCCEVLELFIVKGFSVLRVNSSNFNVRCHRFRSVALFDFVYLLSIEGDEIRENHSTLVSGSATSGP